MDELVAGFKKPVEPVKPDPALAFFRSEVSRVIVQELSAREKFPLTGMRVADLGCGFGFWLDRYREWGARGSDLFGIEMNPERACVAAQPCGDCNIQIADACCLPFAAARFDIVSQFTLFSSIPSFEKRAAIAAEMVRVLRPGGLIISYDFFAPNVLNPRTRPLRKGELRRLFPNSTMTFRPVTLAPPLARMALRVSIRLTGRLESIPVLKTHNVAFIEP